MRDRWITGALLSVIGLGAVALTACDEVVDVANLAPTVEVRGWCVDEDRTFLVLDVSDREEAPVDLVLCVGDSRVASGGAGSGLTGLRADREASGTRHLVEWSLAFAAEDDCACGGGPGSCAAPPTSGAVTLTVLADDGTGLRSLGEATAAALADCAP